MQRQTKIPQITNELMRKDRQSYAGMILSYWTRIYCSLIKIKVDTDRFHGDAFISVAALGIKHA